MSWLESVLGFFLALLLCTAATKWISHHIQVWFLDPRIHDGTLSENAADWIMDGIIALVILVLCHLGLVIYKKIKTHRYPGSYVYCFKRKKPDTKEEVFVFGYFHLECLSDGGMVASGASFDWVNNHLPNSTRVGWRSKHVGASEVQKVVTCYILYDVNEEDKAKRPYGHGFLRFKHLKGETGIIAQREAYHGHMQAVDPPQQIIVYEQAYGERVGKQMTEADLKAKITTHADEMLGRWKQRLGDS